MHWLSIGIALLVATAIIVIGLTYLFRPRMAVQSFGLPLPEPGANVAWWLRLKGTRDIVSGLVLLAVLAQGSARLTGLILLVQAVIPASDMLLILTARGVTSRAFGIHGVTAALMVLAALAIFIEPGWSRP